MKKLLRYVLAVSYFASGCTAVEDPGVVEPVAQGQPDAYEATAQRTRRPDLVVVDYRMLPTAPVEGDTVTFEITVKNTGREATPQGTIIGVGMYDAKAQNIAYSDTHVNALQPGALLVLKTNKTWSATAGTQRISAFVDDVNRIPEANESNNSLAKLVTVQAAPPKLPDLVVSDVTIDPQQPVAGQPVVFSATVKNMGEGSTPVGATVSVRFTDGSGTTLASGSTIATLAPDASVRLAEQTSWTAREGTHEVSVIVDEENRIAESNDTNNTLTVTISVAPVPAPVEPDLVVIDFGPSPVNPKAGDVVSFTVTVKNQGTGATPAGTIVGVGFRNAQGTTIAWTDTYTQSLAPGASVQLTTNKNWLAVEGSYTITAHVDDVNRIPESNETNNQQTKPLVIVPNTSAPAPTNAKPASALIDSMGVNTHFAFTWSRYWTSYAQVKARLLELGVKHIRDGSSSAIGYKAGTNTSWAWNDLAASGIKMDIIGHVNWTATDILDVLNANRNAVHAIEGQNEGDIFVSGDWVTAVRNFQMRLWNTVKNNTGYQNLPVLGPSVAQPYRFPNLGDLQAYMNFGNIHSYPGGQKPSSNLDYHLSYARHTSGNLPVYATETGYHTAVQTSSTHLPISERGAGKYLPRLYLDYFAKGVMRTYIYQLYDHIAPSNTDPEANFGLVRYDFSVRPAFTNLKNMIAILRDGSPNIPGGKLDYTLSGTLNNVRSHLFQKSNGKYYLALYQDVSVWNTSTRTDITNPTVPVTVTFPWPRTAALYQPSRGSVAVANYADVTSLTLQVPDEVIILEIN